MREGAVQIVDDDIEAPEAGSRPPGWLIVAVVVVGIGVASYVVSQASTNTESPADPAPSMFEPSITVRSDTPIRLRGHVAVTSPGPSVYNEALWVFRPGGSVVSRKHFGNDGGEMLMTSGHVLFGGTNGWIWDVDLVDGPTMFGTNRDIIPGAEPGVVWFARGTDPTGSYPWVAHVDVGSLTVGDRVDITDVFTHPVVGVADGLIVVPVDHETYGRFAYWSPTNGLVSLNLHDPGRETVITASGDLVVVASSDGVSILDIASGNYVGSFAFNSGEAVTSACLSPDRRHVSVVGSNGEAVVGNTTTGEVMDVKHAENSYDLETPIQLKNGIGWTANDQVVFIAGNEDPKSVFGLDMATGERFHMAHLEGPGDWWLTASGTMC
jgi:hypothetical protein